jgi:hypothetical protein
VRTGPPRSTYVVPGPLGWDFWSKPGISLWDNILMVVCPNCIYVPRDIPSGIVVSGGPQGCPRLHFKNIFDIAWSVGVAINQPHYLNARELLQAI